MSDFKIGDVVCLKSDPEHKFVVSEVSAEKDIKVTYFNTAMSKIEETDYLNHHLFILVIEKEQ